MTEPTATRESATPTSAATRESATPAPRFTPLRERHETLGASFTDFGGWQMPVRYTSDLAEHHAVRESAGIFDISHMAEFTIVGAGAGDYLDYALAGRLSALAVGKAKYSLLLAEDGGIIDDVIVYRLGDDDFLIISNAGNRDAVREALTDRVRSLSERGETKGPSDLGAATGAPPTPVPERAQRDEGLLVSGPVWGIRARLHPDSGFTGVS